MEESETAVEHMLALFQDAPSAQAESGEVRQVLCRLHTLIRAHREAQSEIDRSAEEEDSKLKD